jgi:hypothetical protein
MVHSNSLSVVGLLLVIVGCGACTTPHQEPIDPDTFPYRLEKQRGIVPARLVDFEGDGRDEIVRRKPRDPGGVLNAVGLNTMNGRTIQQINYAGRVPWFVQFLDLEDDGVLEALVPALQNGSHLSALWVLRGKSTIGCLSRRVSPGK